MNPTATDRTFDPIGVFDSGIGGLTVANAILSHLPLESISYYADTGHVPYGPRSREEISGFAHRITQYLLDQGSKLIVVACNTATAAALHELRASWPEVPFVGMEPAVKPAALATKSGKVGVLATAATFRSERYATLMHRFARDVQVWENPCIGLVPLIEARRWEDPETDTLLRTIITPMLQAGIDTLVLGCTHYPFLMPLIRRIAGPDVTIIDPAPAVARQVERQLAERGWLISTPHQPHHRFFASGNQPDFAALLPAAFRSDHSALP
ncbi:MAG: glutamate racemase [Lewinella sp.]|nr:glutamate racemase [Lewinella sp.]